MKDRKLHMIGNAHIDPVWLWQWQEGFQEVKATFRSALDRMKEYDDFVFTASSAAFYEWVEQNDPPMFQEICERVAQGRWELVGGWWVEPDCNIPSGESFVRQGLYAQRYFKEKFGIMAKVGYCPDSFGHNGMLPQILKKSGMDAYVFMRPMPHEKGLPARLFWWEADDGSRVLTLRIPFEYCTWPTDIEMHVRRCAAELKEPLDELACFYGVGNHGGGPTRENIDSIRRLNQSPDLPQLEMSTLTRFFKSVASKNLALPVVHDDLQHHSSGCYSAHSGIKRWNRQAENLLLAAEKFALIANWVTGQPYPADFRLAWTNVLFNQFHDIMAGTSIEPAYDDARNGYGEAMAIAGRALNHATQSIASNIRVPFEEGVKPLVVFNPHAWASRPNVELEFGKVSDADVLVDDAGIVVPMQRVQSRATAGGRNRISFVAELPALGYRVYRVVTRADLPLNLPPLSVTGEGTGVEVCLENARWRMEFDPQSGCITSLRDKKKQVEVFSGEAAKPVVIDDSTDTWAHNVFNFNKVIGCFTAKSVRLIENGPVKSVMRVVGEYGASRLCQDFVMYRDLDPIDVHVTLDWREQFKMLKLRFPVNLSHMKATSEIPYGHIERFANGEEEPGQSWLDLSGLARDNGEPYGLSILNDGKYSYDVYIRDIGLTVLRSAIYANHMPEQPQPDRDYAFMDQGMQHFTYTLLPHAGSWEDAGTVQRAEELNQPAIPLITSFHPNGTLAPCDSFLSVDKPNIIVNVVKQSEDEDYLILRAFESASRATDATILLPKWNRAIRVRFNPCEIKTVRIPRDVTQPVRETNLLEMA